MIKMINERDLNIVKNVAYSFIIKGGALIISVLTMPAYINFFNDSIILGLWFTILSVLNWFLTFDLGIGNGLRNSLVETINKKDKNKIRVLISSSYILISFATIIIFMILFVAFAYFDWNAFFSISPNIISKENLIFSVRCVFLSIALQFILKLVNSILYSLQKASIPSLIALITSILQLAFILIYRGNDPILNLKYISIFYILSTNIPLIIASFVIFKTVLKGYFPRLKYFEYDIAKKIILSGSQFFYAQIAFMILIITNEFFITYFFGSNYVVEYQAYFKIFTLVGTLFNLALTPIWSAVTKGIVEKDFKWLLKTFKILHFFVILAFICEFVLVALTKFIFLIWIGNEVIPKLLHSVVFACYGVIFIYQSVLSTFACGLGRLKVQNISYTVGVILKMLLIFILSHIINDWIIIVIINSIALLPYCIIEPISIYKFLKGEEKRYESI